MIAAIALLDKIKNIKCHVSKKRKRNMYNFASTIKSKHEHKILPRSKPKVLQRKTELSRVVYIARTIAHPDIRFKITKSKIKTIFHSFRFAHS